VREFEFDRIRSLDESRLFVKCSWLGYLNRLTDKHGTRGFEGIREFGEDAEASPCRLRRRSDVSDGKKGDEKRFHQIHDSLKKEKRITLAFSCGARSPFTLKERNYFRNMLSRRQLQGFVGRRATIQVRTNSYSRRSQESDCLPRRMKTSFFFLRLGRLIGYEVVAVNLENQIHNWL
jgi:hypothetical protein